MQWLSFGRALRRLSFLRKSRASHPAAAGLLAPPELLQLLELLQNLPFASPDLGIVSRSDLQARNLRALAGPQWGKTK